MQRHLVRSLAACTALTACEPASRVAAPLAPDAPALSMEIVASATGSAHYFSGGELRTMGFSAVAREDSTASRSEAIATHTEIRISRFLPSDSMNT